MKVRRSQARKRCALVCLSWLGIVSCSGPSEPVGVVLWEAVLEPSQSAGALAGTIAMVANQHNTQIGIGVTGGMVGARLGWAVRTGTCGGSGTRVAGATAYPAIVITAEGNGAEETVINRRIATDAQYAGEVFANADGTGPVLSCGTLTRTN